MAGSERVSLTFKTAHTVFAFVIVRTVFREKKARRQKATDAGETIDDHADVFGLIPL